MAVEKVDLNDPAMWELPPPKLRKGDKTNKAQPEPPKPPRSRRLPHVAADATVVDLGPGVPRIEPLKYLVRGRTCLIREVPVSQEVYDEIRSIAAVHKVRPNIVATELLVRGLADYQTSSVITSKAYLPSEARAGRPVKAIRPVLSTTVAKRYRRPQLGEED